MKLIQLSEAFYDDYPYEKYPEIMQKHNRPYYCLTIEVYGKIFAIPLRHHISHRYAFYTGSESGLDYKKAVVIGRPEYISNVKPHIDTSEFRIIKSNEDAIFFDFRKFLGQYIRASKQPQKQRSDAILQYCTLKYFDIV